LAEHVEHDARLMRRQISRGPGESREGPDEAGMAGKTKLEDIVERMVEAQLSAGLSETAGTPKTTTL
jgi:hypothetical protein